MFWKVEARAGLYVFFKTVCDYYGLIPEDNYTIPSEAEGIEPATESRSSMPPMILKREPSGPGPEDTDNSTIIEGITDHSLSTAGTTKRHRHSPSVGATAVSTVVEEAEEEEDHPREQSRPVTQIFESTPEDSNEAESEEPEEPSNEAEAAEESVPVEPKAVPAEDEPEKQSVSEEANADSALHIDEKQSEDEANVSNDADEAGIPEIKVPDDKTSGAKESEESTDAIDALETNQSASDSMVPGNVEKKITPASEPGDEPTEEKKTGE